MAPIRRLFTHAELVALKRCLICCQHPRSQGHHDDCPAPNPPSARGRLRYAR